jgi:hypothetical protein
MTMKGLISPSSNRIIVEDDNDSLSDSKETTQEETDAKLLFKRKMREPMKERFKLVVLKI